MLGFVLASMSSMLAGRLLWGCVFFVAALGFKQMALYYAPAIFAYLLGVCVFPRLNIPRLVSIAIVTLACFAILVTPLYLGALYDRYRGIDARPDLFGFPAPLPVFGGFSAKLDSQAWYYPVIQQTAQLLFRVFPFSRGLFEDKVANFWCSLNVLIKLKSYPIELLQRASLLATLGAIAPPCFIIFLKPRKELLPLALSATAWGFFLFSFQVHEKSILLPLMPLTVLLASKDGMSRYTRSWIGFANLVSVWTLFPLLERVDLRIPYCALSLLWAYLLGLPPTSMDVYRGMSSSWTGLGTILLHGGFYTAMIVWHVLESFLLPPSNLPDLWVVINVGIGAVGFGICYLWCMGNLAVESGLFAQNTQKRSGFEKGKAKML
jgi:alpha-1,3-glucosyltransferase